MKNLIIKSILGVLFFASFSQLHANGVVKIVYHNLVNYHLQESRFTHSNTTVRENEYRTIKYIDDSKESIDLVEEVIVSKFTKKELSMIHDEAKSLSFGLKIDDKSSVCGFELYIGSPDTTMVSDETFIGIDKDVKKVTFPDIKQYSISRCIISRRISKKVLTDAYNKLLESEGENRTTKFEQIQDSLPSNGYKEDENRLIEP